MPVPDHIRRFTVIEHVGSGTFASVWQAHDTALDSPVAIKVLSEHWLDDLDVRRRFAVEAKLLRQAESDRLVRVHDIGELPDGRPYLVMTHADRGTLDQRLAAGPLPWPDAVAIAIEIELALGQLHRSGVLHRDIKPSNILFRSTPDNEQLLLGDLGLGKLLAEASRLTLGGGTPAFMAPAQASPGTPLTVRADLYGLGAVLYLALTGTTPSSGDRPAPSTLAPGVPAGLDRIVACALASSPTDRYPDATALVADLREVERLGTATTRCAKPGATHSRPDRTAASPRRSRRRWRLPVSISLALLLVCGVGIGYWFVTHQPYVAVADRSGTLKLSVPRDWAVQVADRGWNPALLGVTGQTQPGILITTSVADFQDPHDTRPGVFAGILPAASQLDDEAFARRVKQDQCQPAIEPHSTAGGIRAAVAQQCGGVIVREWLVSRVGRLVWLQVKQPAKSTLATDDRILASLRVAG